MTEELTFENNTEHQDDWLKTDVDRQATEEAMRTHKRDPHLAKRNLKKIWAPTKPEEKK